jgi:uncharacterized membrane protein
VTSMSQMEFVLVRFDGVGGATQAFTEARTRSRREAPWIRHVGLVEHHSSGHLVLRGTFAGHYLDVDEALHTSERGAAEGFAAGAVLGVLGGPPGLAVGMVLGALVGSQTGQPSEVDLEPRQLVDRLRDGLPGPVSAIALIAETGDVEDMLTAIGDTDGDVLRQSLTADQVAALETSLGSTPLASPGPSVEGEESVETS